MYVIVVTLSGIICGNNGSLPGHERAGSEPGSFQGTSCRINDSLVAD